MNIQLFKELVAHIAYGFNDGALCAGFVQFFTQANHAYLKLGFVQRVLGDAHACGNFIETQTRPWCLRKRTQQGGLCRGDANRARWAGQIEFMKCEHSMLAQLQMLWIK